MTIDSLCDRLVLILWRWICLFYYREVRLYRRAEGKGSGGRGKKEFSLIFSRTRCGINSKRYCGRKRGKKGGTVKRDVLVVGGGGKFLQFPAFGDE